MQIVPFCVLAVQPHWPAMHPRPFVPQPEPHDPQLLLSFDRFTHEPLQLVCPGWQDSTQLPPLHAVPAPHWCEHVPQLALSVCRFTHVPLQLVCPGWHDTTQLPLVQIVPAPQVLAHVPQL